jgi:tripartite-type tricarboxylate transporter receptor subunit TctC
MAMLTTRRSLLLGAALATVVPVLPTVAQAQGTQIQGAFPDRPIRVVVPFPAGGTTDMLARLFAQRMTEAMGQPVVVENRGGAGGSIGADVVAKAAPDGYTLLFHNLTFTSTTTALQLANRAPHDIERDFAPVSLAANVPMLLVASAGVPARDLREFVAFARAPGQSGVSSGVFYGSTGPGSIMNLAGEVLKRDAGITMEHVPFRGAAPMVQEMVAGRVQFGGDQLSTALGHVRSGTLKPMATLAAQRSATLPDVPTVREQGFPNMELRGWNGFFVPARTPEPVIARLHREIAAAAANPEIRRRMAEVGAEPVGSSPDELRQVVSEQVAQVRPLVAELRLQVE